MPTETISGDSVPVGPVLSMFDPVFIGVDEYGLPVYSTLLGKNLLSAGEPGAGKSTLLNNIVAHAALSQNTRLCLLDGKWVELGQWEDVADVFVGPNIDAAIITLARLQRVINNRYAWLFTQGRRKITRRDRLSVIVCVVDEIAYYSATVGDKRQQETFVGLLRDVVARGRACGVIVVAATQRPNVDIIPTSLRDIFGWRHAGRCTTDNSSDLVLGHGWAIQGYSAMRIRPEDRGVGYLIAEGGMPRLVRTPFLTDTQIESLVDYAAWTRRTGTIADPTEVATVLPLVRGAA